MSKRMIAGKEKIVDKVVLIIIHLKETYKLSMLTEISLIQLSKSKFSILCVDNTSDFCIRVPK